MAKDQIAKMRRERRKSLASVTQFENAIKKIHPELASPATHAELQRLALSLAALTRHIIRQDEYTYQAIEELKRQIEGRE